VVDGVDLIIHGTAGKDRMVGTGGDDVIDAGGGNDTVYGGDGDDTFVANTGDGNDSYFGEAGSDTLDMSAILARVTVDLGGGSAGSTQSGADRLSGIENVVTGAGADSITASTAANVMAGGAGNDTFRFTSAAAADGDTILDFQQGDVLDLSGIDANAGKWGNQAFTLVAGEVNAAAQLMVSHETRDGVDYTVVAGNTGGDAGAEFRLSLKGAHDLDGSDFKF
jgi:Ca2+-binding RTX toxin-like protein